MSVVLWIVIVWAALIFVVMFLGHRLEQLVHRGERER